MPATPTSHRVPALTWDVFCHVVDNLGDIGVCWRFCADMAHRGEQMRLWIDQPEPLRWMAPGALEGRVEGVRVLHWTEPLAPGLLVGLPAADVWIETFGCRPPPEALEHRAAVIAAGGPAPVWINLEHMSAEPYVERSHRLPSLVSSGPLRGVGKWFFYPGFTPATGGLLREADLLERQAAFKADDWLRALAACRAWGVESENRPQRGQFLPDSQAHSPAMGQEGGVLEERRSQKWTAAAGLQPTTPKSDRLLGLPLAGERRVSLFCYEPPALPAVLQQVGQDALPSDWLVTPGRAMQAVTLVRAQVGEPGPGCQLHALPTLTQRDHDHLLWACDLNCVRGEDSLVRALWAGQPFVWHIYPQHDNAHHAKLDAFLDWLQAPPSLRTFHRLWNGMETSVGPVWPGWAVVGSWKDCVRAARQRLLAQPDLATQLLEFIAEKR